MRIDILGSANFAVVVNNEEQYSLWPADCKLPTGWRWEGVSGTRETCLDHIANVWTNMVPLSLRTDQDRNK